MARTITVDIEKGHTLGIGLGLVGLGSFGSAFVRLFASHPLVDRVALCDTEPARIQRWVDDPLVRPKLHKAGVYESLDDICRDPGLDALVVMTQPWLHAAQCVQVLESGKHVYSAVPLLQVPDGDEILEWCVRIVEAVQSAGRQYMLGETSYYHPEAMFMRRKSAEGAFGRFISAETEYSHDYSGAWGCSLRTVHKNRCGSRIGRQWPAILKEKYIDKGILNGPMHYPTHSVAIPVSVMNARALKVSAIGLTPSGFDSYPKATGSAFGNETAFFHMSNGAALTVREHREVTGHGYEARIFGTCGTWRGGKWLWTDRKRDTPIDEPPESGTDELSIEDMRDPMPREVQKAFMLAQDASLTEEQLDNADFTPQGHGGSHPYLVHEFISAAAADRPPAINAWEAAHYMAMGVMAHKSALKGGELLEVPDLGGGPTR